MECTVWVKKIPPEVSWQFFLNRWEFFDQVLCAYYAFLSTREYEFLFNYLQLRRSYAILSMTTKNAQPLGENVRKFQGGGIFFDSHGTGADLDSF